MLLRRALDLRNALRMGIRIGLDEIRAEGLGAITVMQEQRNVQEAEET